jgi:hypothetical protein
MMGAPARGLRAAAEPPMSQSSRLAIRLRQHALRCYEIALYALLAAMAVAGALPASSAEAQDRPLQCGNIQSSAVVIAR